MKKTAYRVISSLPVHYKSVMFYDTSLNIMDLLFTEILNFNKNVFDKDLESTVHTT
jgi:hypothetical protein